MLTDIPRKDGGTKLTSSSWIHAQHSKNASGLLGFILRARSNPKFHVTAAVPVPTLWIVPQAFFYASFHNSAILVRNASSRRKSGFLPKDLPKQARRRCTPYVSRGFLGMLERFRGQIANLIRPWAQTHQSASFLLFWAWESNKLINTDRYLCRHPLLRQV